MYISGFFIAVVGVSVNAAFTQKDNTKRRAIETRNSFQETVR